MLVLAKLQSELIFKLLHRVSNGDISGATRDFIGGRNVHSLSQIH